AQVTTDQTNNNGVITAIGVGSTQVIVQASLKADTINIVVTNNASSVVLTPANVDLTSLGQTAKPVAQAFNAANNVLTSIADSNFTWTSTDPTIATVSNKGVVTAVSTGASAVGQTLVIAATANGKADTSVVTVSNYPKFVDITSPNQTINS